MKYEEVLDEILHGKAAVDSEYDVLRAGSVVHLPGEEGKTLCEISTEEMLSQTWRYTWGGIFCSRCYMVAQEGLTNSPRVDKLPAKSKAKARTKRRKGK